MRYNLSGRINLHPGQCIFSRLDEVYINVREHAHNMLLKQFKRRPAIIHNEYIPNHLIGNLEEGSRTIVNYCILIGYVQDRFGE
jgi:hypothetical protein